MLTFKPNFFSIIFLGSQNPQILNHDFLINNSILPLEKEPFKSLQTKNNQDKPYTQFISTPVITSIHYNWISIVIEANRYQIKDDKNIDPASSAIIGITKKYFAETLKFTPLEVGGVNFNGTISFSNDEDENKFDEKIGINKTNLLSITGAKDCKAGINLFFPWENGIAEIKIIRVKNIPLQCSVNFNYEFKNKNIDALMDYLGQSQLGFNKFIQFLESLEVEFNGGSDANYRH